jgi:hypothetical protein
MCVSSYRQQVTAGRVYEAERNYPGDYEYVTADDGVRGAYAKHRFRPLTRQEEETYVRSKQAAAQSDAEASFAADYSALEVRASAHAAAPDGNPKTRFGMAKPPLALIPGPALVHLADAFRDGAGKYGPANWRNDPVTTSTYINAALRHVLAYFDGEDVAEDSGVLHLAHAMGCLAILIDADAQGTLNDDRPTAGQTSRLIKEKTRPLA